MSVRKETSTREKEAEREPLLGFASGEREGHQAEAAAAAAPTIQAPWSQLSFARRVIALCTMLMLSLVVALSLFLLFKGLTSDPTAAPAPAPAPASASASAQHAGRFDRTAPPTLHWASCPGDRGKDERWKCGHIDVPLDHLDEQDDRVVRLATVKYSPNPNRKSERTVVVNPGGPGGSGTSYAFRAGVTISANYTPSYDVLGFDPRGVNLSTPAASCYNHSAIRDRSFYLKNVFYESAVGRRHAAEHVQQHPLPPHHLAPPPTHGEEDGVAVEEAAARALRLASAADSAEWSACRDTLKDLPRFFTTAATARDVDLIRQALGEDALTAYMVSYGTGLGQTYSQLFPQRVGRMILDGLEFVIDHRERVGFGWTSLDNVTDAWRDGFIGECVRPGAHCPLSVKPSAIRAQHLSLESRETRKSLEIRLEALLDHVFRDPIGGLDSYANPQVLRYDDLIGIIYASLYNAETWPDTAKLLLQLENGNATLALDALRDSWSYDPRKSSVPRGHRIRRHGHARGHGRAHETSFYPAISDQWSAAESDSHWSDRLASLVEPKSATRKSGGIQSKLDPLWSSHPLEPEAGSTELENFIICGDAYDAPAQDDAWYVSLWKNMTAKSFISGDDRFFSSLPCKTYPYKPTDVYRGDFDHQLQNPLLLIGETYDPATPLRNGERLARALGRGNARLIRHHGYGHSSRDRSICTENFKKAYLSHGEVPEDFFTDCLADSKPYSQPMERESNVFLTEVWTEVMRESERGI
ncbi:hypothetical protein IE81DRAFT_321666 [Ceraceosorus guamensis]|uniref:Alpha/beta-hydrolase n=1 Tax=Ceraceosorus guamensis TaxID=1522189 RepID=A0A316W7G7_9BASI|nr:hypothetical protein IE81DRAFT_321666 [Ceraceosorus guamensis]PWN44013.1 hypothetical protein IE81DRAFT_321666 [Ceraceosorus guamensis]